MNVMVAAGIVVSTSLSVSLTALAQGETLVETTASGSTDGSEVVSTESYTPEDFAVFAPRTALDMVRQIPGFSISGSNGGRGFGQANENVLINGQRISSKSTSAREALSRIPASNVERIDIVDGAGLDIPGLSGQVANIIAKADGISGTWTYRMRFRENLPPAYEWLDLNVNGRNGTLGWTLGFEVEPGRGTSSGRRTLTTPSGDVIEYREESFTFISDFIGFNGALNWTPTNGHIANFNAEYNLFEPDERETANVFAPDGTLVRRTQFKFKENEWNSELSGDYDLNLGPGRFKLIGLQRWEHSPTRAQFFGANLDGTDVADGVFSRTVDESETILRGEYSWTGAVSRKADWQVSLEGAFNTLESEAQQFEGAFFATPIEIPVGQPSLTVEERRGEAFITHGRDLNKDLRLQVSLGVEQSEIRSESPEFDNTGALSRINEQTETFTRPKGEMALTWTASDDLTLTTSIERQVGQLNFFDFVSNVDLNLGDDQTGNINIVPSQRWRFDVQAERDFGEWGALTATVFAEQIEDLTGQLPIFGVDDPATMVDESQTIIAEGPGNISEASRYGLDVEGTLLLKNLGWTGAQIEYELFLQDTFVEDPLTGETRDFNGNTIYFYELELRHDIPNTDWAWGVSYETFRDAPNFRSNVRRYFEQPQGFAFGFIEHKDLWGMTGSVFLANLLDSDDNFQRISYTPDRRGQIETIEERSANFGYTLTFRLRGTF